MKEPSQWDENDIAELITEGTEESPSLEYKGCGSLVKSGPGNKFSKEEISKDISALANSGGGTLVYGVVEDRATKKPVRIDVGYDPADRYGEFVEQVIVGNIQPRIEGFIVHQVSIDTSAPGKVIYVVSVPQSNKAHMAADHRYHKRHGTTTAFMEDYEVRDVNRRGDSPDLILTLTVLNNGLRDGNGNTVIQVNIDNKSSEPAEHAVIVLIIEKALAPTLSSSVHLAGEGDAFIRTTDVSFNLAMRRFQLNWGSGMLPIWQSVNFNIGTVTVTIPPSGGGVFIWEIATPRMQKKQRVFSFRDEDGRIMVDEAQLP